MLPRYLGLLILGPCAILWIVLFCGTLWNDVKQGVRLSHPYAYDLSTMGDSEWNPGARVTVASMKAVSAGLLEHLELNPTLVVVELNREILDRNRYDEVAVAAGDVLELVHFVGGG